ncbi:hypothetical protein [Microbacterium sp.]|nr:hypothetical protein [Microbacterium sp.]
MFDGAFLSHVILLVIGAISACGIVSAFAAMFAMGRSGYRKD